jgi:hypothetical protein
MQLDDCEQCEGLQTSLVDRCRSRREKPASQPQGLANRSLPRVRVRASFPTVLDGRQAFPRLVTATVRQSTDLPTRRLDLHSPPDVLIAESSDPSP